MNFSSGYYITAELKVKEGVQIETAKAELLKLCAQTRTEPGCMVFALHHDAAQPTRFLLWECFKDEAAFKQHFEETHTKEFITQNLTEVVQYFQTDIVR